MVEARGSPEHRGAGYQRPRSIYPPSAQRKVIFDLPSTSPIVVQRNNDLQIGDVGGGYQGGKISVESSFNPC